MTGDQLHFSCNHLSTTPTNQKAYLGMTRDMGSAGDLAATDKASFSLVPLWEGRDRVSDDSKAS